MHQCVPKVPEHFISISNHLIQRIAFDQYVFYAIAVFQNIPKYRSDTFRMSSIQAKCQAKKSGYRCHSTT